MEWNVDWKKAPASHRSRRLPVHTVLIIRIPAAVFPLQFPSRRRLQFSQRLYEFDVSSCIWCTKNGRRICIARYNTGERRRVIQPTDATTLSWMICPDPSLTLNAAKSIVLPARCSFYSLSHDWATIATALREYVLYVLVWRMVETETF